MSNDLQYISFAGTDIRVMQHMAKAVGDSTVVAGKKIQEGLSEIAKSNRIIAQSNKEIAKAIENAGKLNANAVLKAGQLVESGFASIADEIRRKTYMEEYYLLQDKIDSLEDKIIAKGGKLQELYDNFETEYIPPIVLSFAEILTMNSCFDEEAMEWFKMVVSMYKVNPWNFFVNILEECHDKIRVSNKLNWYQAEYFPPIYICYPSDNDDGLYWKYQKNNTEIKDAVLAMKESYDANKNYCKEQLDVINEFNVFINGINVEIMMENLRLLHTQLREVYRQMKCQ